MEKKTWMKKKLQANLKKKCETLLIIYQIKKSKEKTKRKKKLKGNDNQWSPSKIPTWQKSGHGIWK